MFFTNLCYQTQNDIKSSGRYYSGYNISWWEEAQGGSGGNVVSMVLAI
jgi:hypothetical protein